MRPLIAAEPILRAPRPDIVSESTLTGVGCGVWATALNAHKLRHRIVAAQLVIVFIAIGPFLLGIFFSETGADIDYGLVGGLAAGFFSSGFFGKASAASGGLVPGCALAGVTGMWKRASSIGTLASIF